jgi:hypothetical protein
MCKVVGIVTDNPRQFISVVDKLQSINTDVTFKHIGCDREIKAYLTKLDKIICYIPTMWAEPFFNLVFDRIDYIETSPDVKKKYVRMYDERFEPFKCEF